MSHRDYARQQLVGVGLAVAAGRALTAEQQRFLVEAGKRAAAGENDPIGYGRARGDRSDSAGQIAIALEVHQLVRQGVPTGRACDEVAQRHHRSGGTDGAVGKAYQRHRAQLEAVEVIFAPQNTGLPAESSRRIKAWATIKATFAANEARHSRKKTGT